MFSTLRDDLAAAVFEFVGTTFWLLLGLGGIQTAYTASGGDVFSIGYNFFVAASMGLSLIAATWLFFRGTGAVFNPNVSLALVLVGAIGPVRFVLYCIAQFLGAIAAAALVHGLLPGPLNVDTYLKSGTSRPRGVFIEMFITAAFALAVLCLAAEKHRNTAGFSRRQDHSSTGVGNHGSSSFGRGNHGRNNFTPVGLGMTLFACHLFAYLWTGASMNVARSFGPGVVNTFSRNYHNQHWVYWVGPLLGSLLAAALYTIMKFGRYWSLTPDQTVNDYTDSPPGVVGGTKNMLHGNPNAAEASNLGGTTHGGLNTNGAGGVHGTDGYNRPTTLV